MIEPCVVCQQSYMLSTNRACVLNLQKFHIEDCANGIVSQKWDLAHT